MTGLRPSKSPLCRAVCATAPALLLAGCLFPMPIEAEEVEENLPPFYVGVSVVPPPDQVHDYDRDVDGERLTFSVGLFGDPNVEDRLFFRWFVNYDPQFFTAFFIDSERGPTTPPATLRQGQLPMELILSPCSQLQPWRDRDLHRIELIVADRPFLDPTGDDAFPNKMLPEDAKEFRVVWFLETPTCPSP